MSTTETRFATPFGDFDLHRYPATTMKGLQQSLRAWDAADELALNWLAEPLLSSNGSELLSIVTVNDTFGALSIPLHSYLPIMAGDSFLGHEACRHNLAINRISKDTVQLSQNLENLHDKIDYLIIKIPKTLALLEDQLYNLRPFLQEKTVVLATGMVKHIHNSTLKLFNDILGQTHTSLARKKARLIFCQPQTKNWRGQSPYPTEYQLENSQLIIHNHANVFSRSSLDIGTRLFLSHLPSSDKPLHIVDLGCGNGLVGLIAAQKNPQAALSFYDESYMALLSAEDNFVSALGSTRSANYYADNCMKSTKAETADLILNNPPFHQGNVVGDFIARQMFKDAKRVLRQGGELWVIGNRHLGYHSQLKRLFGNVKTMASDKKFVVLQSTK